METTYALFAIENSNSRKYTKIMQNVYIRAKADIDDIFGDTKNQRNYLFDYKNSKLANNLKSQFKYKLSNNGVLDISEYVPGVDDPQMFKHYYDILMLLKCQVFLDVKKQGKENTTSKKKKSSSSKKRKS